MISAGYSTLQLDLQKGIENKTRVLTIVGMAIKIIHYLVVLINSIYSCQLTLHCRPFRNSNYCLHSFADHVLYCVEERVG